MSPAKTTVIGFRVRRADGLILFHGAGSDRDYETFTALEDVLEIPVERVNFPYRMKGPGRRPPDRMPKLIEAVKGAVDSAETSWGVPSERIALGGHSMGGRAASMAHAAGLSAAALVLMSYPLHPQGKPEKLRIEHFGQIIAPVLLIQGNRDPLGKPEEFEEHLHSIKAPLDQLWLDGNHDLRKHSSTICSAIAGWLSSQFRA